MSKFQYQDHGEDELSDDQKARVVRSAESQHEMIGMFPQIGDEPDDCPFTRDAICSALRTLDRYERERVEFMRENERLKARIADLEVEESNRRYEDGMQK